MVEEEALAMDQVGPSQVFLYGNGMLPDKRQLKLTSHLLCSFTWCAFIAQAALIGNSTRYSNDLVRVADGKAVTSNGVAIYWGQSTWLVLGAAVVMLGWTYEAVRWRAVLAK